MTVSFSLLTLTLNLYSALQLEASSPIENYTLRKLSPCLSVLECKHAESTNNCRERQRLLSIGRDAEEILNSYTNCKYKLLNGTRTTWQCIVWTFIVRRQAPKDTGDSHARTSRKQSVPGRNESKFSWINRTTLNPLWMSETFTPRCGFWTSRRFHPASYVDLTQTFSRRGFPSLPCLRSCVKYLMNVRRKKDGNSRYRHNIRRHFFDRHSCIRVQSSSVNRQAWFIFIGPDCRATISESYITYISMTKCLRR